VGARRGRHPGRGGAQPYPAVAAGHRRRDHPAPEPLARSRHGGGWARGGERRGGGENARGAGSEGEPELPGAAGAHGEEPASPADAYLSSLAKLPLRLTSLGTWQANVLLRAAGAVAPVIGGLAGADAAALIEGVAGYDEHACRAELRAWCRERGDAASRELAPYVRAASGFEQRMLAFAALSEAGPAAEAEVRPMLADPSLRPHAQHWLVDNGFEGERSLDPPWAMLLMTERWPRSWTPTARPGWSSTWSSSALPLSKRPSLTTCGEPAPHPAPRASRCRARRV